MRSPFKQTNISSLSLEGMEKPVRSFKSFVKSVPPNPGSPAIYKPLPPTPSPPGEPTSPPESIASPPTTPGRTSSVASWKAPADWFNSAPIREDSFPTPPISASREYSPLLPEPSPDPSDKYMELHAAQSGLLTPPQSRLMPIYERSNRDLGPPRTPPRSPLPIPPKSTLRAEVKKPLPSPNTHDAISDNKSGAATAGSTASDSNQRVASPAQSTTSRASDNATDEKTYLNVEVYQASPPRSPDQGRPDRQYMRGKKLRALNKGNPLSDNSWEDPDMDEKTRQLSFSQDYHDLLVDQYQEMSVRPEEILRDHTTQPQYNFSNPKRVSRHASDDHELVPQPLAWRKESSAATSRSASWTGNNSAMPNAELAENKKKQRLSGKISTWVPHRLSVGPKRSPSTRQGSRSSGKPSIDDDRIRNSSVVSNGAIPRRLSNSRVDREVDNDLRFSMFFPPSKPIRFGRKGAKVHETPKTDAAPPMPLVPSVSAQQMSAPIMRLPGGLTVIKTPPPLLKSEEVSIIEASSTGDPRPSMSLPGSASVSENAHSPISNPSERRFSYNSQQSAQNTSRGPAVQSRFRVSMGSAHSHHSNSSSHPLAQETSQTQDSQSFFDIRRRSSGDPDAAWRKPGFLEKAREARRRHNRQLRQQRLKNSIKVLGPTDPGVVAGYVKRDERQAGQIEVGDNGRLPGYLVSGSM
ncbi:hypothetical protein K491DRAFT_709666 [Lophiostoma macrostomum CBS 122681]|uniref:Uncharacterized protein n=1 Tax=Lophiostoma macrostomum CBS 122681 TaxID=1314788 RepID=A0A6A6TUM3_9PLEO|nr:hypothetical protein K491DRAFT_709666 [Lophiostoma macrostomum CBS 122681]